MIGGNFYSKESFYFCQFLIWRIHGLGINKVLMKELNGRKICNGCYRRSIKSW